MRILAPFDRAMSIEPKYRFTDARDLAAAFEKLTRVYIELGADGKGGVGAPAAAADTVALVCSRDEAEDRASQLQEQVEVLREKLVEVQAAKVPAEDTTLNVRRREPREVRVGPPGWWSFALVVSILLQGITLLTIVVLAMMGMWRVAAH